MKVVKSVAIEKQTWKELTRVVGLLKERNMGKSISDVIEQLIKCFLAESKIWLEQHAYNNSEALLEEEGMR